jgi:hypothetical protein
MFNKSTYNRNDDPENDDLIGQVGDSATRDALDMAAFFEDSTGIARTVAECDEYIKMQDWSPHYVEFVVDMYRAFVQN